MNTDWKDKTPDQRRQLRIERWRTPENINFVSEDVKKTYTERVQRVVDAIELKKTPDRVPILSPAGFLPCFLYGKTCKEVMYDIDVTTELWERYALEFPTDLIKTPGVQGIGRAMELLDYRLYKWPGHGIPDHACFQAVELEAMKSDEYQMLLDDPSDLWLRRYLPRVFGALDPLSQMPALTNIVEIPNISLLASFGQPGMREALNSLVDAGEEFLAVRNKVGQYTQKMIGDHGFAISVGGGAKAPFDVLADTMRASHHMMMDMYRQRDMIEKAVERLIPLQIKGGVEAVNATGNPLVFLPLHKGADGFMSDEQFSQLYWPSLKAVILGLIEEGCIPYLFAEGGYNSRLDYLNELPKGSTLWLFDQTDMAAAKKKIGDRICIAGNVPSSLMVTGTADQVDEYCKQLIDDCAPGGGYILCSGAVIDEGKAETIRALIDSVGKYGQY